MPSEKQIEAAAKAIYANAKNTDARDIARIALTAAETATDAEPVAWLIHAPEDDYHGIGPVTLQFTPLEQWDLDKGYTQTPLYTHTTPSEARLREALEDIKAIGQIAVGNATIIRMVSIAAAALKEANDERA